ncbi:hypothetical protein [Mesorhizobium caraganae]|uniref:hypothetical protein n=1 Tax=Mesorhizobium caraganae TaxID=483206 RepID=UPI003ECF361F
MSAPLELRNSVTGKIFPAIGPLLIGAIFGFGALRGLAVGADGVLIIALVALGCLGLGYVIARGAFDRSVQVTLDSQGFRDARAGDVLVPWAMVKSVHLTSGKGAAMLNFELTREPPDEIKYAPANALDLMLPFGKNIVHMEVSSLDVRGQDMVEAIKTFAPHVVVRR